SRDVGHVDRRHQHLSAELVVHRRRRLDVPQLRQLHSRNQRSAAIHVPAAGHELSREPELGRRLDVRPGALRRRLRRGDARQRMLHARARSVARDRTGSMRTIVTILVMLAFAEAGQAATRNNDDSCDISVVPAATLLLPFFDVTVERGPFGNDNTLFTITNVSSVDQIAHVTVWTDGAYPLLAFNVLLTGYDVQAINLYDVLVHGTIGPRDPAPLHGVTRGSTPRASGSNPNIVDDCADAP